MDSSTVPAPVESIRCVVHVPPLQDWPSLTQLDPIMCPAGASVAWLKGQLAERLGVAARNIELLLRDTHPPRAMQDQYSLRHEAARVEQRDPLHVTMKVINASTKSWSQVAAQAKDMRLKPRAPSPTRVRREVLTAEDAEAPEVLEQHERDPRNHSAAVAQRPRPTERVLISDLISPQFDASLRGRSAKGVKVSLTAAATAHREAKPKPAAAAARNNPNPVDGTTTIVERGKERLEPKKHRPTKLKKIIQAERNGKVAVAAAAAVAAPASESSQPAQEDASSPDDGDDAEVPASSCSPDASEAVVKQLIERPFAVLDVSRRSPTELEMNRKIVHMLSELRRFQARAFAKNPDKAKKRVISGLREVERAARRNKLKCVLMAPNVDDIQSEGGLNDLEQRIAEHCRKNGVPLLLCMSRSKLGKAMGRKSVLLSVVGVEMMDGCEQLWKEIVPMYQTVLQERAVKPVPLPAEVPPMTTTPVPTADAMAAPIGPVAEDAPAQQPTRRPLLVTAASFVPATAHAMPAAAIRLLLQRVAAMDHVDVPWQVLGPVVAGEHLLSSTWCFWFTRKASSSSKQGTRADQSWYEKIVKPISTCRTVEEFWHCYSHLVRPNELVSPSDYHLFKQGISPLWEDEANQKGGKWMVRLRKGLASEKWESLILALIGDTTGIGEEICGCVASIRYQEDIIAVWNRDASDEAKKQRISEAMRVVLDLPAGAVFEYKEHNASLRDNSSFRNTNVYRPPGMRAGGAAGANSVQPQGVLAGGTLMSGGGGGGGGYQAMGAGGTQSGKNNRGRMTSSAGGALGGGGKQSRGGASATAGFSSMLPQQGMGALPGGQRIVPVDDKRVGGNASGTSKRGGNKMTVWRPGDRSNTSASNDGGNGATHGAAHGGGGGGSHAASQLSSFGDGSGGHGGLGSSGGGGGGSGGEDDDDYGVVDESFVPRGLADDDEEYVPFDGPPVDLWSLQAAKLSSK